MSEPSGHDAWRAGDAYELYMGRWSRLVASRFLDWLAPAAHLDWLDIGCGAGALSNAVVAHYSPTSLTAVDLSEEFVAKARATVPNKSSQFIVGDAQALPVESHSKDVIVSALLLNFVPDRGKALAEMKRVARAGATIAFYVWDYPSGRMELIQSFWNAALSLAANAKAFAEDKRFAFCTRDGLMSLAEGAGFQSIDCVAIDVPINFCDFDDYWRPFTLGAGPAPGYLKSLDVSSQQRLREKLSAELVRCADGSIALTARAWAIKGVNGP